MTLFGHVLLMMSYVLFVSECTYISMRYGIEMLLLLVVRIMYLCAHRLWYKNYVLTYCALKINCAPQIEANELLFLALRINDTS